jgi:hypothetical protein
MPPRDKFSYTFDNIAGVIDRFTEVVGPALRRLRLRLWRADRLPDRSETSDRITAIISERQVL